MTRLPGAIFIVDILREKIAVKEAQKLNIPIFAMVDTNSRTPINNKLSGSLMSTKEVCEESPTDWHTAKNWTYHSKLITQTDTFFSI